MQEIIKYQQIDMQIKKLNNELASSKNKKGAGEMQQYLKDGQAKLLKLEEVAENLTKQYEKAVKLYNDFVNKLEILTKSVESVGLEKVEELENTINNFKTNSEALENNIGALANKMNQANKEIETLMNNAKKAKHNLDVYKTNYTKEKAQIEPEVAKLSKELLDQKAKVDKVLLAKYLQKSEGKTGPVFVPETNGKCGGCRMEISASKRSELKAKGVIECENCGRLIYKI